MFSSAAKGRYSGGEQCRIPSPCRGNGNDTLRLDGSGIFLDLETWRQPRKWY